MSNTSNFYQNSIFWVEVDKIKPNPFQPRREFDEDALRALADSIKQYGVLQALVVTRKEFEKDDGLGVEYELIAGERRLRASKIAGLSQVPVIIRTGEEDKSADDLMKLELAIIENVQREDLNPIEKAKGFQELIKKFGLTHEQIAKTLGKDRSSITNYVRLLDLPQEIQDHVSRGTLSMGHSRALLSIQNEETQISLCDQIIKESLSVREAEDIVSSEKKQLKPHKLSSTRAITPHIQDLEDRFRMFFGTKVIIKERNGKGRITISFQSNEEFSRIANTMGIHP